MSPDDLTEAVADAPQLSGEHLAGLASRFVGVPSVNGEHAERELAMVIAGLLGESGFETHLVGGATRPSLAAVGSGSPKVVLNGHTDTVPVDDAEEWEHDPFGGVIADGAVHGRGACDMKGGLAIQVAVAQWLAGRGLADGLVLHFAMGEERGEPGTESLLQAGFTAPRGIVLEPTNLMLGVAQRGLMTLRILIGGRAGHASRPDLADNPIERVAAVLSVIERLDSTASSTHPLLGAPTWTPTSIHAGIIPSMVPGQAEVMIDRRMIPGETVETVISALRAALAETLPAVRIEVSVADEEGIYEPAEIAADGAAVTLMREAMADTGLDPELFGTPYSSDVRHLINSAGIEAVTFGPGRFEQMHARDERIEIADLVAAARVVAIFCARATVL